MTLRAALLPLLIVTVVGLAACSATGRSARQPPDPSPSPSPVADSTGPGDWWITVNPCGLLDQSQLRRVGLSSPGQPLLGDGPGRANECQWSNGNRTLSIILSGYPYTNLFFHTGQVSTWQFADGRRGELDVDSDGTGGCQLTVETVSGSSALIFMSGRPNQLRPRMCPIARRVAAMIRPQLPRP